MRLEQAQARERAGHFAKLAHASRVSAMATLSASLAHELNQPLTAILANARAAQRFLQQPRPDLTEVKEILDDIAKDDKRAGNVIRRLRAFLEQGEHHEEILDLNEMVRNVVLFMENSALINRVSVEVDLAEGLSHTQGDRIELHQVILNLMKNAMEAMKKGDHPKLMTIRSYPAEKGKSIAVAVKDWGSGIGREIEDRIYEPFFTTRKNGPGIGLFICRSIIEAHGGSLWFTPNEDGPGVTFTFTLPVK